MLFPKNAFISVDKEVLYCVLKYLKYTRSTGTVWRLRWHTTVRSLSSTCSSSTGDVVEYNVDEKQIACQSTLLLQCLYDIFGPCGAAPTIQLHRVVAYFQGWKLETMIERPRRWKVLLLERINQITHMEV